MTRRQMAADFLYEACDVAYREAKMFLAHDDFSAADAEVMFENILTVTREALRAAGNPEAIADARDDRRGK